MVRFLSCALITLSLATLNYRESCFFLTDTCLERFEVPVPSNFHRDYVPISAGHLSLCSFRCFLTAAEIFKKYNRSKEKGFWDCEIKLSAEGSLRIFNELFNLLNYCGLLAVEVCISNFKKNCLMIYWTLRRFLKKNWTFWNDCLI